MVTVGVDATFVCGISSRGIAPLTRCAVRLVLPLALCSVLSCVCVCLWQVPALYEPDEKDALANSQRAAVKAAGQFDTKENCWTFFVNRCRNHLHLVLAMSPSGETLRRRCRNFPVRFCAVFFFLLVCTAPSSAAMQAAPRGMCVAALGLMPHIGRLHDTRTL